MPSLRGQLRVLSTALPIQVRSGLNQAINAVPDVQLPRAAPTLSRGNSFTLNIPSITGRGATRFNIPGPGDGLKAVEGLIPGAPKLSQALGLNGGLVNGDGNGNGGGPMQGGATLTPGGYRATTTQNGGSTLTPGGYRPTT